MLLYFRIKLHTRCQYILLVVLQSLHAAVIAFVSETQGQSPMLYGCLSRPGARELGRPAERRSIN